MARFYEVEQASTMFSTLDRALSNSPDEQVQVLEELALFRVEAQRAVRVYEAALSQNNMEVLYSAAQLMGDALRQVVKTAESSARINALSVDRFTAFNLTHFISQVVGLAYEVFGDEHIEKAERFEALVRAEARTVGEQRGVSMTPDMEVGLMDSTIPMGPA